MNTIDKMKQAVTEQINEDQANYELYSKVYEALKKHDGDVITKRIATSVQKTLGTDYNVYYSTEYGLLKLRIKGTKQGYNDYKDFLLGHEAISPKATLRLVSGDVNASRGFEYHNACYGSAAVERIKKNQKFLKSVKLEKYAKLHDEKTRIDAEIEALELHSYDIPAMYSIEKALK